MPFSESKVEVEDQQSHPFGLCERLGEAATVTATQKALRTTVKTHESPSVRMDAFQALCLNGSNLAPALDEFVLELCQDEGIIERIAIKLLREDPAENFAVVRNLLPHSEEVCQLLQEAFEAGVEEALPMLSRYDRHVPKGNLVL